MLENAKFAYVSRKKIMKYNLWGTSPLIFRLRGRVFPVYPLSTPMRYAPACPCFSVALVYALILPPSSMPATVSSSMPATLLPLVSYVLRPPLPRVFHLLHPPLSPRVPTSCIRPCRWPSDPPASRVSAGGPPFVMAANRIPARRRSRKIQTLPVRH